MGAPTRRSLAHAAIGSAHRMRPVHRDLFASASRLAGNKLHPDRVCYWDRYRHAPIGTVIGTHLLGPLSARNCRKRLWRSLLVE
jgi:hypothetical protein